MKLCKTLYALVLCFSLGSVLYAQPDTGYYALDRRIKKVLSRKTELLTVLEFPHTPSPQQSLRVGYKRESRPTKNCKCQVLFLPLR